MSADPSTGQRSASIDVASRGVVAAVVSAVWLLGWLAVAVAWSPAMSSGHPATTALAVALLLFPLGATLCVGLIVAWTVLLTWPGITSSTRAWAWVCVLTAAALNVAFWLSVFTLHVPVPRADPSSVNGFDQPPWVSVHRSFVLASAQVGLAVVLVGAARHLRRSGEAEHT